MDDATNQETTFKCDSITKGEDEVIRVLLDVLSNPTITMSALRLSVTLKRAEEIIKGWRDRIKPKANIEFNAIRDADPTRKIWSVMDTAGGAELTAYTARGAWEYPPSVADLAHTLEEAQRTAREDNTARYVPAKVGKGDTVFAIKLLGSDE